MCYASRPWTLQGKHDLPGGKQPVQQEGKKIEDTIVGRQDGCYADRLTRRGILVSSVLNLAPGYEPLFETPPGM